MSEVPPVRAPWTLPPIPAVLLAVVSAQGGAALTARRVAPPVEA